MQTVDSEIIRADSGSKRHLGVVLILSLVLFSLYFGYLYGEIEQVRAASKPDISGLGAHLRWMTLGLLAAAAALSGYLLVNGFRVLRAGRFPPAGSRVLRDTRVRKGWQARWAGIFELLLGVTVLLAAVYVNWMIRRFLGLDPFF